MNAKELLASPTKLWSRSEVLSSPCPIPSEPGVYAWYFKDFPAIVPADNCKTYAGSTLLYIGISPKAPPRNGAAPSRQRLCDRVRYHMNGNAEGSTLRLTLGCLLAESLGIQLRRVGSGKRMTFGVGEALLSNWLAENAFVVWAIYEKPWDLESELFRELSLPLNLDQNRNHQFHSVLSEIRASAKKQARILPII